MISERPAEVEDRAVPGHWEGDLIVGSNHTCIATLVERSTRFVMLLKIERPTAEQVSNAMQRKIVKLPTELRRSVTWDQGHEMSKHREFTVDDRGARLLLRSEEPVAAVEYLEIADRSLAGHR